MVQKSQKSSQISLQKRITADVLNTSKASKFSKKLDDEEADDGLISSDDSMGNDSDNEEINPEELVQTFL